MSQMNQTTEPDGSVVEQAQEKIQQGADQARSAARNAVAGQVESRSTEVGRQLRETARAIRQAGEQLQSQGSDGPARAVIGLSDRAERLGSYLTESSSDRLLHDAEHFGRRNPWLVVAGGLTIGIAVSRLMKASSNRRFQQLENQGYSSRRRPSQWETLGIRAPEHVASHDGAENRQT